VNVMAFHRGGDARSIPRIRIPGEHTRDRGVLVGKLAEILKDQRPDVVRIARTVHLGFARFHSLACRLFDRSMSPNSSLLRIVSAGVW
jgi:hypothetical protein